jgi:branched-chain amino acid aminotransferase
MRSATVSPATDLAGVAPGTPRGIAFIDGAFCPLGEARIPLLDWGFLRSDACQDTISVWNGFLFCLDAHLQRFARSCASLRLACPYDDRALAALLTDMVARSGLREAYVQILMMRGVPAAGSRDPRTCTNRFAAFCIPYVHIAPDQGRGALHLVVSDRPRISSASVPSDIKNYHWIDFQLALFDAYDRGGNTVVLTDGSGAIAEGPGFNIFVARNGRVVTPNQNVLDGVTRRVVLDLAGELGIDARPGRVAVEDLRNAEEVFITSTAGGVMPINSVDGKAPAHGAPGPIAARLRTAYWAKREQGWRGSLIAYEQNTKK